MRITDCDKRKNDKPFIYYKCQKCGRLNPSFDTLMENNKLECLWSCLPFKNNHRGLLMGELEQRSI